jgi:hypothetical protein
VDGQTDRRTDRQTGIKPIVPSGYTGRGLKIINLIILFDFVCFTGDYILTGFGCDQAVKRSLSGALYTIRYIMTRQALRLTSSGVQFSCFLIDVILLVRR